MKRRTANFTPSQRSRKPESIDNLLGFALRSPQIRKKAAQYALIPHWNEIVGEEIARVTIPQKIIRGKILKVLVEDSVWAQELTIRKAAILDSLHRFGTGAVIEDIRFITANPKEFAK